MAPRGDGTRRRNGAGDGQSELFTPAPLPVAPLDDAGRLACLRLIRSENVGPVTFRELVNHYGGATEALAALPELARRAGRVRPIAICPAARAESELEAAARHGATPVFTIEPGYPAALAHLPVPPPLLYVRGRLELLQRDAVALVGSRSSSAAGIAMARLVASGAGEAGYVVVSGLARGIDGAAHEASLATGTIAVLAGGIDFVYPPENAALQARIAEEGCLVSEMPPGFQPRGQDFPRRNRIISGLALGVVVIEAARRSGSLITAHAANEQGRLVMAVPGHPLDPRSEGPNALLKQPGVMMVTSARDVVEALAPLRGGRTVGAARLALEEAGLVLGAGATACAGGDADVDDRAGAGPGAGAGTATTADAGALPGSQAGVGTPSRPKVDAVAAVQAVLGPSPVSIDQVARAAGLSAQAARVALMELSLAGLVEQHGGQLVSLRPTVPG